MNNTAKLANQAKDASSGARYLLNSEFVNFKPLKDLSLVSNFDCF